MNTNNNHKPPNLPPLSTSLPSPTRPEPEPKLEPDSKHSSALVAVGEKYYSPLSSPLPPPPTSPPPPPQHIIQFSRREELPPHSTAVHGGGERNVKGVVRGRKKEDLVKRVGLGIRVLEIVLCLISLSVMASDKTQGWSGDSFDRYKEFRFCLTVAIFGFVYSAFQAYDLGNYMATGKHVISHRFRGQFDFIMDQLLAYLLISASSAAASRIDNWQANWGKDEFTEKASASISMSFLAFICFAMSALISGYNLSNHDSY